MEPTWLVTPYFFDKYDESLRMAVPQSCAYKINNPNGVVDRSSASLALLHSPIRDFVFDSTQKGELPISVAGDCAASIPVMAGLQRNNLDPVLVWLDAHGDFNTPETSPSGFLGGMPLAMMVGRGDLSLLVEASNLHPVNEDDVWLVGARDLDPLEEVALNSSQVNRISIEHLDQLKFRRPVHLHIDNDVIDAREVPANNYPVSEGPSLSLVIEKCSTFASQNTLCAISLSGWNGQLDQDGRTSRACRNLLSSIAIALV